MPKAKLIGANCSFTLKKYNLIQLSERKHLFPDMFVTWDKLFILKHRTPLTHSISFAKSKCYFCQRNTGHLQLTRYLCGIIEDFMM